MRRPQHLLSRRLVSWAVLIALSGILGGCSSGMSGFDPTDFLDFLDTKKKLPGDRKPVFPEGVPGLQPGVPRELYKGARAEPEPPGQVAPSDEPKGRKATKSASRRAAPQADTAEDGGADAAPAAPKEAKPKIVRRRTTAPPPDPDTAPKAPAQAPARQPAQATAPSAFPAPLPSGSFTR